jgi:hypothetical protein
VHQIPEALLPFVPFASFALLPIALVVAMRFVRNGGPGRIATIYPAVSPTPGTRLRRERGLFGRGYFSMARMRVGADQEHLHVRVGTSWQGVGAFSVPLQDITAVPDRYGWMVLSPDTVRLRLTRAPEEVVMLFRRDFEKLAEASGGKLALVTGGAPPCVAGGTWVKTP